MIESMDESVGRLVRKWMNLDCAMIRSSSSLPTMGTLGQGGAGHPTDRQQPVAGREGVPLRGWYSSSVDCYLAETHQSRKPQPHPRHFDDLFSERWLSLAGCKTEPVSME
jgi:hypothetical protein